MRMFSFCIPRRRTKRRILSSLLILAILLTFWLVRQEVNKTKRDVQSVIPSNLFYILSRVRNIRAELVVSNEASPCIFKCRILMNFIFTLEEPSQTDSNVYIKNLGSAVKRTAHA